MEFSPLRFLIRSLPSLGVPVTARTQYLAPIRYSSLSKPSLYHSPPHNTRPRSLYLASFTPAPYHYNTAHTRSPHHACPRSLTVQRVWRFLGQPTLPFPPPVPHSVPPSLSHSGSLDHTHCPCLFKPQLCLAEAVSHRLCGFQRCTGLPTCYSILGDVKGAIAGARVRSGRLPVFLFLRITC
jgi:hypothetical protein